MQGRTEEDLLTWGVEQAGNVERCNARLAEVRRFLAEACRLR